MHFQDVSRTVGYASITDRSLCERVPVFAFGPAMAFTYSHSAENGQPQ